jgi:hypothetical protein
LLVELSVDQSSSCQQKLEMSLELVADDLDGELDEGDEGESDGKESIEDEEDMWEVIEITAEKRHRYRVRWAGTDPATGRPWRQSWVRREDCTADLVKSWEETTVAKKTVTKQTVASAAMETSQR